MFNSKIEKKKRQYNVLVWMAQWNRLYFVPVVKLPLPPTSERNYWKLSTVSKQQDVQSILQLRLQSFCLWRHIRVSWMVFITSQAKEDQSTEHKSIDQYIRNLCIQKAKLDSAFELLIQMYLISKQRNKPRNILVEPPPGGEIYVVSLGRRVTIRIGDKSAIDLQLIDARISK